MNDFVDWFSHVVKGLWVLICLFLFGTLLYFYFLAIKDDMRRSVQANKLCEPFISDGVTWVKEGDIQKYYAVCRNQSNKPNLIEIK